MWTSWVFCQWATFPAQPRVLYTVCIFTLVNSGGYEHMPIRIHWPASPLEGCGTHSPFSSYSSLPFSLRQGLSLAWTVSPKGSPVPFSPSQGSELILPNPAFLKWILGMELHSWDLQGKHVNNYFPRSCIQHIVSLPKTKSAGPSTEKFSNENLQFSSTFFF